MQINKIYRNMNFGLMKAELYKKYETQLINDAKNNSEKEQLKSLAKKIGQKAPYGVLGIDADHKEFVLTQKINGNPISYNIGKVYSESAIKTLSELNKNLAQFQRNPESIEKSNLTAGGVFYSLQKNGKLPQELKRVLSDYDINNMERVLSDI